MEQTFFLGGHDGRKKKKGEAHLCFETVLTTYYPLPVEKHTFWAGNHFGGGHLLRFGRLRKYLARRKGLLVFPDTFSSGVSVGVAGWWAGQGGLPVVTGDGGDGGGGGGGEDGGRRGGQAAR